MKWTMTLRNHLTELEPMRDRLSKLMQKQSLPETVVADILLIAEEVLVNIVTHAYDDEAEHLIGLSGTVSDHDLWLEFRDDARPFNPLELPEPDLDTSIQSRDLGGLGIYLVTQLADQLRYSRQDGMNVLAVRKILSRRQKNTFG
jgi:anti-sigma regulatory factor (Ser/Thr protein kinase)